MAFQAFLGGDRQQRASGRLRAHLQSGLLHAGLLLLLVLVGRAPVPPAPIAVARLPLAVPVVLPRPAAAGPTPAESPAPPAPTRPPRRRPTLATLTLAATPAVTIPTRARPGAADATARGTHDLETPPGVEGDDGEGAFVGDQDGDTGTRARKRLELFARIIGSGIRPGTAVRSDRPFISLKEATALRTSDFFPRLPAALWTERAPYMVALEVCVSEEGRVSEASLRSHASPRLDPIVLAAVRGWRYQPRTQGGRPTPFCHGVLIRYEISY